VVTEKDISKQELGKGLVPDAGFQPGNEVTWPRLSVIITAIVGICVLLWAHLAGAPTV